MAAFDFLDSFYLDHHTRRELVRELDGVLAAHRLTARVLPFYSYEHPAIWLPRYGRPLLAESVAETAEGVWQFERTAPGYPSDDEAALRDRHFFIYEHEAYAGVYVLITVADSHFFLDLCRTVERRYPNTVTTFVKHQRLLRLLTEFRERCGIAQLTITKASHRARHGVDERTGESHVIPSVSWPKMGLEEAFQWLYDQNGWFQTIEFTARREHTGQARISLGRRGVVRTTGLFPEVFSCFVEPICKLIHENVGLFSGRSRRDRPDLSVRPLVIDFGVDQLREPDERRRLIGAMRRLKTASISVLHGNPYVHLCVSDYYDGSVFDVWVLSPREVTIVPQMKGTYQAIERLIHHIFDTYAEGHIKEYEGRAA